MKKTKVSGTFSERVYAAIRTIPPGETRTYAWVAKAIGKPKAARAVGQALGRNTDPARNPCHRVIASDGTLGGYAWGLAKKQRLLAQEKRTGKNAVAC